MIIAKINNKGFIREGKNDRGRKKRRCKTVLSKMIW